MAYNDEALKAKLSTLNETQDSIVSVSQWITFHKRHADRISSYWLTRLRDAPPPKRLNFIYLVNDIVQNARARKRPEFPDAFAPLMPEAVQTTYQSSTPEIQNKIRRVVEVWKSRSVWETGIQSAIESRIEAIDKTKSSSGKKTLGGSLFNSSSSGGGGGVPSELSSLPPLQIAVTKATLAAHPALSTAKSEFDKLNGPDAISHSPPVHAARLSSLMKSLATAESSITASIKARQSLITDLERILSTNKTALEKEETTLSEITTQRKQIEGQKREVEDKIMRGLAADSTPEAPGNGIDNNGNPGSREANDRPEVEELTPEPESFSPKDDVAISASLLDQPGLTPPTMSPGGTANTQLSNNPHLQGLLAGFTSAGDSTNVLAGRVRQASGSPVVDSYGSPGTNTGTGTGIGANGLVSSAKRRKTSHGTSDTAAILDLGEMGMDVNEHSAAAGLPGQQIGDDMLGSLEGDVDELIRSQGAL